MWLLYILHIQLKNVEDLISYARTRQVQLYGTTTKKHSLKLLKQQKRQSFNKVIGQ
jgi:hypothetical protein